MKLIEQSHTIIDRIDGVQILKKIERVGRLCYRSDDKITDSSCYDFVKMLIDRGHEAMIEHVSISVLFTTNRRVSHEFVRHRIPSYAQESQRYCDYGGKDIEFIDLRPFMKSDEAKREWVLACQDAESSYKVMRAFDEPPQIAGGVLDNDVATRIVVTTNLREWRHILRLRTAPAAHPQMQVLMKPLLDDFKRLIPVVFDDIEC